VEAGIHCSAWKDPKKGAHLARAAQFLMAYQNEAGHCCPIAMTYGAVPSLRQQPEIFDWLAPKLFTNQYDPSFQPMDKKKGILLGMFMTEMQGGSDVRSNVTEAKPIGKGGPGEEYLISGRKWFCSAPMSDGFLILAQTPKGISCFYLPRFTPDGKINPLHIQRLKNKMGDRSNCSSEIDINGAWARMIGEEGRGVPIIIEMASSTRFDCILSATALIRQAAVQALHHCQTRNAFGDTLRKQPLMKNVLADLCLESEASTLFSMRLAEAYDNEAKTDSEGDFRRLVNAVGKFYITKRSVLSVFEAMEVLGGNGYTEDFVLARMHRQTPLNSIWEGSGNVICLDVLRALSKEKQSLPSFVGEVEKAKGQNKIFDTFWDSLLKQLRDPSDPQIRARRISERMALALQASLMLQFSDNGRADAFCESRLAPDGFFNFGNLSPSTGFDKIIDSAFSEG